MFPATRPSAPPAYPSGIIDSELPGSGTKLPDAWALQDPDDYISVQRSLVSALLRDTGIAPESVAAMGIDFTNCTMLPAKSDGTALCQMPEYREDPHSWVKLWKHHAAERYAKMLRETAQERQEPWLARYGNTVSGEWLFPKILQIYFEDREIYDAADIFIEAVDWVVMQMTEQLVRSSATLGVNAFWSEDDGYPGDEYFSAVDPGFGATIRQKLVGRILPVGSAAGHLSARFAAKLGLTENTVVSIGHGDSEVAACGLGVTEPNKMIMVMGTSQCYQYMSAEFRPFPGLCAVVKDGMIPGYYAYEAGQCAVGDIYDWFVRELAPAEYIAEAGKNGQSIYQYMNDRARAVPVGSSGLVALDWLNGNRSLLMNYDLTGLILGLTIRTKPEEIYKALVESTAFGARAIIEAFRDNGLAVNEIIATGGLALKAPYVVQTFADVIGTEIHVCSGSDAGALGSAVCAAVAFDNAATGRLDFTAAAGRLVHQHSETYTPDSVNHSVYNELYAVYKCLSKTMGETVGSPMEKLREIKSGLK